MKKILAILTAAMIIFTFMATAATAAGIESVSLSTYQAGAAPEYAIRYQVAGKDLYQANNSYISVIFPHGTDMPAELPADQITLNSLKAKDVVLHPAQDRIDILIPADLAVNQTVDIIIKAAAGVKNPALPGRYVIGVFNSGSSVVSQFTYNITARQPGYGPAGISVSPATAATNARYDISFFLGAQSGLTGGQDVITVKFPAGTSIPSYIRASDITVNGYPAQTGSVSRSTASVVFTVPDRVNVPAMNQVNITISKNAGINNPAAGTHTLEVNLEGEFPIIRTGSFTISGGSINTPWVSVSPATQGSAADYTVIFNTGQGGSLYGGTDSISITFPQEISLPSTIGRNTITVNGKALDSGTAVTVSGRKLTFTIPSGVYVDEGGSVTVNIDESANIYNPRTAGTYYLSVSTSKNTDPVNSHSYNIEGKKQIYLVVNSRSAFIDNVPVTLDSPAIILNGRTMVPIRFVAEALGATVNWNNNTREVTILLNNKTISLTIDSVTAYVNGIRQTLDAGPVIRNDRTLVPIRFLAENFGAEVTWHSDTQIVEIVK